MAGLGEAFLDPLGDGDHIALGAPGDEQEGVREGKPACDVERDQVGAVLRVGSGCRELDQLDGRVGCRGVQNSLNT